MQQLQLLSAHLHVTMGVAWTSYAYALEEFDATDQPIKETAYGYNKEDSSSDGELVPPTPETAEREASLRSLRSSLTEAAEIVSAVNRRGEASPVHEENGEGASHKPPAEERHRQLSHTSRASEPSATESSQHLAESPRKTNSSSPGEEGEASAFENPVFLQASDRTSSGGNSSKAPSGGSSTLNDEENLFDVSDLGGNGASSGYSSSQVGGSPTSCGTLDVTLTYKPEKKQVMLTVHSAKYVPCKDRGGYNQHRLRMVLLPKKRKKSKSKIQPGSCPEFEETFTFKLDRDELEGSALRLRLYGSERLRREGMVGEVLISLTDALLKGPAKLTLTLEPRCNMAHTDWAADVASLTRSDTSSLASLQSLQHGGAPELLLGLSYLPDTGRLKVIVQKGSNLRDMAQSRPPDTYVKVSVLGSGGEEVSQAKTTPRRGTPHPLYSETLVFQVGKDQLKAITLMVAVFCRRAIRRKEMIGWFSLGSSSSGEEETSHWEEVLTAQTDHVVNRWHLLLEA